VTLELESTQNNQPSGGKMKRVSFGVALVVSALVIGCQDSSNNNPISSDNVPSPAKRSSFSHSPAYDGVIELKEVINKGRFVESAEEFSVNGSVAYTILPSGADQEDMYTVTLVSDVTVQANGDSKDSYSAYDESVQDVSIPKGPQRVVRSISLFSTERPLRLYFEFDVDAQTVTLASVQIDDDAFVDRN
jgi:hypothetical protein